MSARFDELRSRMHDQGGDAQEFAELAVDALATARAEARAAAFREAAKIAMKPAGNRLQSHQDRQYIIAERIRRAAGQAEDAPR